LKLEDRTGSVGSSQSNFNFVFCVSAMPCNQDEVDMNAPDPVPPCTPPKPSGNGGAGRVDPEGKVNSDSENSDEPQSAMTKRKWNGRESWTMIKRWPAVG
jgi:hypothetical protein